MKVRRMRSPRRCRDKLLWLPLLIFLLAFLWAGCSMPGVTTVTAGSKAPLVALTPTPRPLRGASQLDAYLTHLAESGLLSGAVLVAHNGMLFEKGYSLADKDARRYRFLFSQKECCIDLDPL